MAGAVEQQIGAEIFFDVVSHRINTLGDLTDRVGKARQRHGQGIDGFPLRVPFGGDRFGNAAGRRDDLAAGRRADRLAVERDREAAVGLGNAGLLIEPLALRRAGGAAHRLLRIER